MANNDIIELLDILYGMVNEAWSVPLGNDKCIIEREKAIEIINEIKVNLPTAIAEAQRLVSARDEFIGNAKREAEAMRKNAEEQARIMIEEQEIVRVARAKSKELRRVASEYVEQIMSETERSMQEALATVQNAHNSFKALGGNAQPKAKEAPAQPKAEQKAESRPQPKAEAKQAQPAAKPKAEPKPRPQGPAKIQRIQREE